VDEMRELHSPFDDGYMETPGERRQTCHVIHKSTFIIMQ
jgi:hypothetical protein